MSDSEAVESKPKSKTRRRLIILGSVVAMIALLLVLLPLGIRWGATYWLNDQGVKTQIEDIDLNLFTGTFSITNARGENEAGKGFNIEHALVNLRYWPLFSKQIYLSNVELLNSSVDVRIDEQGVLHAAGLAFPASEEPEEEEPEEQGTPWGIGLDRAAIGEVTVRYEQPNFAREITLSNSSTSDLASWEPNEPFPIDATLSIEDSQIKLDGTLRPFGDQILGDIQVGIKDFDLKLVAPLAKQSGISRLAGVVNTDLAVALDYQAGRDLALGVDGEAGVQSARVIMPDLNLNNASVNWRGKINAKLLQADGGADAVDANGHLNIAKIDVALPDSMVFRQDNTDWQGSIKASLGEPLTIAANGELKLDATHLNLLAAAGGQPPATVAPTDTATAQDPSASENTPVKQDEASERATPQESPEPGTPAAPAKLTSASSTLVLDQGATRWKGSVNASLGQPLTVQADGNFGIKETELAVPGQVNLAQGALEWNGKINATVDDAGPAVDANGKLTTQATDLALPANEIKLQQQAITWEGALDYAPGEPALINADGGLQADGLNVDLAPQAMALALESIAWSGQLALDPNAEGIPTDADLPLSLSGQLDGTDIVVTDTKQSKTLARVDSFALQELAISSLDDIRGNAISVKGISALERAQNAPRLDEYPFIARLGEISLSQLNLRNQSRVGLDTIRINGIDGLLYRGPKASWEASTWFGEPAPEQAAPTAATAETQTPPPPAATEEDDSDFELILARVLIRESRLAMDDRGVSPAFATELSNLNLTMADLNSTKPAQGSALDFFSALGRYGSIKANGIINPFLEPPSADVTGRINAVNLAPISGYTAQAIDRRIDQGTFSADLKFNLDRGKIDANAELTLTKLRIGGAQSESGVVQNNLGLPLNKILSLLRNPDGNINLDLPVGGDLENPEFSILKIVRKAIFTSLKKAVLVIYSPIKLGKGLVNLATALRLEPVVYEPGKAVLGANHTAFLDTVVERMTKRPKTELVVCGHVVPADRAALNLPNPDAAPTEDQPAPTPEQLAQARDELFALATERTSLVGDYLVSKNIHSSRFVLCNPALGEPQDAQPRTSLSY